MCGIIALTATVPVGPFLLAGLQRLKKRGYDSAGMALGLPDRLSVSRVVGAPDGLEAPFAASSVAVREAVVGIAHTRWATHGPATEANAHPHIDCEGRVAIVHNGIIENWRDLAVGLRERGHLLRSQTDTELIAHLVEERLQVGDTPEAAVLQTLPQLHGAYGLVVLFRDAPGLLVAARQGSPVLLGHADALWAIASSHEALFHVAQEMLELKDGQAVALRPKDEVHFLSSHAQAASSLFVPLQGESAVATRDIYPHFMIKEIFQGPDVVRDVMAGRLDAQTGRVALGGLSERRAAIQHTETFLLVGCGSAYYAGLFGKRLFEECLGVPTDVQLASEFAYGVTPVSARTTLIAVSQSGETKETALAVERWNAEHRFSFGVLNGVGSLISRLTGVGMYTRAGEEVSVASTKALLSQLVAFVLLTLYIGELKGIPFERLRPLADGLAALPAAIERVLQMRPSIAQVAQCLAEYPGMYFLGRQRYWPIACEGALKLKEVSGIHAEAYPTPEMKHGPLALVGERFPCIVLCPRDELYDKHRSAVTELVARRSPVVAVTDEGNGDFSPEALATLAVPDTHATLKPILAAIVFQILAYEAAVHLGRNVDFPKNLAKIVTVE